MKAGLLGIVAAHRALLSRLLPGEEVDDLSVREGQFHTVIVGSDRVACFPRTRAAADRLPERVRTLRVLADLDLGFCIPEPLLAGVAGAEQAPFLLLTRIPGEPLDPDALRDVRVIDTVAAQYTTLLSALAQAGTDVQVRSVLPQAREDRWTEFAEKVRAELFHLMSRSGRLRAERELAALENLPHLTRTVVHGDLGAENVLWEWRHGLPHLSGVLDWDDVELSDQAEDLAAIEASYGTGLLTRILGQRNWSHDALSSRVAAIRGTFALQQALYAAGDGDVSELADGLADYL